MENQSLAALTFRVEAYLHRPPCFIFHKGFGWAGRLAALLSILIVQSIYIPLAAMNWAGLDVFAIHFGFFHDGSSVAVIIAGNGDAYLSMLMAKNAVSTGFH